MKGTSTTFAELQEGQTIFYTIKGERNRTKVVEVKSTKGLAFKAANGSSVRMSKTDAEGFEYKSSDNVLWSLV